MERRRILILDRASSARGDLAKRLNGLGYDVVAVAESVTEAEHLVASTAPDVAVVSAPWVGGLALSGQLEVLLPLPIVYIGEADEAWDTSEGSIPPHRPDPSDSALPPYLIQPVTDRELVLAMELARSLHRRVRAQNELESFFAVSVDHFCFLGFDGRFTRLNPAWERTLGFTLEELMSRPFIEFVHPDDRDRTLAQNAVVRAGGRALLFENRYVCKDGSYRWFLWTAAPHPNGGVIYSAARDITELKNAEAERARLESELTASEAEVRHLREILPICSYCRKIRDDEDYWHEVEDYIAHHTSSRFSHGICPDCMVSEVEPQLAKDAKAGGGEGLADV